MNFAGLPPEINSLRMYSGPGSGPLLAAAAAWDSLAAELSSAATACGSAVAELSGESWLGPSSQAMAAACVRYLVWLSTTAAQAEQTATQARAAAAAYGAAFAMTVPPSVVAANRAQMLMLVATNILGQNTAAIAATEADYAAMWAQDAAAMDGYVISAAQANQLPPFTPPPQRLAPAAATSLPVEAAALPDLLGLNALAVAGLSASDIGVGVSAGAWQSADQSTMEILKEQDQLQVVQYDILHAIDLFSPLTPSRPDGFIPPLPLSLQSASAAMREAVSVGKLSVPISWAANAPEVRSLAYTARAAGVEAAAAAAAAVPATAATAVTASSAGTAFSQMALAGMGGSALAGSVKRGGPAATEMSTPPTHVKAAPEPSHNPITGIAAEIREFAELRDRGLITSDEYNDRKQRLLER